jgi:hypothetical protein
MADDQNPQAQKKQDAALSELQSLFAQFQKDTAAVNKTAAPLQKSLKAEKDD